MLGLIAMLRNPISATLSGRKWSESQKINLRVRWKVQNISQPFLTFVTKTWISQMLMGEDSIHKKNLLGRMLMISKIKRLRLFKCALWFPSLFYSLKKKTIFNLLLTKVNPLFARILLKQTRRTFCYLSELFMTISCVHCIMETHLAGFFCFSSKLFSKYLTYSKNMN